ncbi:MoxR family ATPase [Caulobacter sp. 17J65-9]|uniref:AAA family ATPase n=1 Tax=Caulobacter sp. 17J65-9 TaxID=2709382 RepID=UPI0013CAAF90|nr:MoxR family ATPase [Caulobacter sp. 17J65-9]NEX93160.1 MoxR family ATPase [Caulobacter sp. 17J65-9]
MHPAREAPDDKIAAFERASQGLEAARKALRGVVFGQDGAIELALATVVAEGHALVVGAPGMAKTRLIKALGRALGLSSGRMEFHPALGVDDLVGREVVEERALGPKSRWAAGPLFTHLLLADEIDRAAPAVQAVLFEAMHERRATVGGLRHNITGPFHVFATRGAQGPGPHPLSESQVDRFMVQVDMTYPDREEERRVLLETGGRDETDVTPALSPDRLFEAQKLSADLPVGQKIVESILELVRRARPDDPAAPPVVTEAVEWGPGPRAGQALMRLARARALVEGRVSPSMADVKALALPVLKHRLVLTDAARRHGITAEEVVGTLTARL